MDVVIIPVNQLPAILSCLIAIMVGWDRIGTPLFNWFKGKPFDFIDAVASLMVGGLFMIGGFAALLYVIAHF